MTSLTTNPNDQYLKVVEENGMQKSYLILNEEERKKGFIRPLRTTYTHKTCGGATTMGVLISETYARDPKFYGATYCIHCHHHYPIDEFYWDDGTKVGS